MYLIVFMALLYCKIIFNSHGLWIVDKGLRFHWFINYNILVNIMVKSHDLS